MGLRENRDIVTLDCGINMMIIYEPTQERSHNSINLSIVYNAYIQ